MHVDQEEADALLLLHRRIGAHQTEHHVGVVSVGRPRLLPVDDVAVALADRPRSERREVGARAGLRIALTPPILFVANARQVVRLLPRAAELHDHRPDHVQPEWDQAWRAGRGAFLVEDVLLYRRPTQSAIGLGPMTGKPAPA